jgi:hypothetical protein
MGANEIQQANVIILKMIICFFSQKQTFSYESILEQLFLQLVIINVYNHPSS